VAVKTVDLIFSGMQLMAEGDRLDGFGIPYVQWQVIIDDKSGRQCSRKKHQNQYD
jgi:hypothetical protein